MWQPFACHSEHSEESPHSDQAKPGSLHLLRQRNCIDPSSLKAPQDDMQDGRRAFAAGGAHIAVFAMCADNEQGVTLQGNLSMASSDESSRW